MCLYKLLFLFNTFTSKRHYFYETYTQTCQVLKSKHILEVRCHCHAYPSVKQGTDRYVLSVASIQSSMGFTEWYFPTSPLLQPTVLSQIHNQWLMGLRNNIKDKMEIATEMQLRCKNCVVGYMPGLIFFQFVSYSEIQKQVHLCFVNQWEVRAHSSYNKIRIVTFKYLILSNSLQKYDEDVSLIQCLSNKQLSLVRVQRNA